MGELARYIRYLYSSAKCIQSNQ